MALVMESLSCFASRSETGAISSPKPSGATANTMPIRIRVLAPRKAPSPEQRTDAKSLVKKQREDAKHSRVHHPPPGIESQAALGDPGLDNTQHVCIDHVGEQRKEQIHRTARPGVDEGQGDRKQCKNERGDG